MKINEMRFLLCVCLLADDDRFWRYTLDKTAAAVCWPISDAKVRKQVVLFNLRVVLPAAYLYKYREETERKTLEKLS